MVHAVVVVHAVFASSGPRSHRIKPFVTHPIFSVPYARIKRQLPRPATSISSFHLVYQHLANNNRYHYNHLGFVCTIRPPGRDARSPETGVCFTYVQLMRVLFLPLPAALFIYFHFEFTVLAFLAHLLTLFIPSQARGRSPFHPIPYHAYLYYPCIRSHF